MAEIHKTELVEGNRINCYKGQVKISEQKRLVSDLRKKIPKDRPKVSYTEKEDEFALAYDLLSYLLFCEEEKIKMASFYNNLLHTGNDMFCTYFPIMTVPKEQKGIRADGFI